MPGVRKRGIYNIKAKEPQRKELRNFSTAAEAVPWRNLKNGQLKSKKFRRQQSIGPYIVDFYCPESRLIVCLPGLVSCVPGIPQLPETPFLETGRCLARGHTPLILASAAGGRNQS